MNVNEKMMEISLRIRELREIMGMTAEQAAEASGIDGAVYAAYENGKKEVTVSDLYRIASVLKIDPTADVGQHLNRLHPLRLRAITKLSVRVHTPCPDCAVCFDCKAVVKPCGNGHSIS